MRNRAYIHHTLQVVDVDIAQHVRFANAKIGRGEYTHVKEIVMNSDPNGVSALLIRSKAMDSL